MTKFYFPFLVQNLRVSQFGSIKNNEIDDLKSDNGAYLNKKASIVENPIDKAPLLMGMFVVILFGARISGSHYNPLITFSYMIGNVRQGKFDRILGLFYVLSQFAGAMLAGLLSLMINADAGQFKPLLATREYGPSTLTEIIGSFILVFMYLCSTEEKTKFSRDSILQTMVLSGSYLAAMVFAGAYVDLLHISPVNPAIALAMIIFNSSDIGWISFWIFTILGFAGSFLAYLFFRFVYIKTVITADEIEEEEAENEENNKEALLED